MNLSLLNDLKHKLLNEPEFAVTYRYFMDEFAENVEFLACGTMTNHPFLETFLDQVAKNVYPNAGEIENRGFSHIAAHSFYHGPFMIGKHPGMVFYFEDICVGMAAICNPPPSIEVKYSRFRGVPLHDLVKMGLMPQPKIKHNTKPSDN
jgi:hypothetical protein